MSETTSSVGRFGATTIALVLGALTLLIALLTPEEPGKSEGGVSTFSTAPGGAGILYELAGRFGWHTERRTTTLDSARQAGDTRATVQVVLAPREPLGAHEIHSLLDNVRRGGGLVFSLDGDDALRDSIGIGDGFFVPFGASAIDSSCTKDARTTARQLLTIPPQAEVITWKRHAPGVVERLTTVGHRVVEPVAVGFPMGKGRVAVVGGSDLFTNASLRICPWDADVLAMRVIEYARNRDGAAPILVFDEFHHGFGVHGGSLKASAGYLWRTSSGHLLAQLLAAGLVLLFAMAPRPLVPRDDTRVTRRSPLEHAAALGRAYEDVGATRTATSTLLSGLRRRTRGIVAVPASATDDDFLAAVARRIPALAPRVELVNRARSQPTAKREFAAVGQALAAIEGQLQSTPPSRS